MYGKVLDELVVDSEVGRKEQKKFLMFFARKR